MKTEETLMALRSTLSRPNVCWGGDWNHALEGKDYAGSRAGRETIEEAIEESALVVLTASLPSAIPDHATIDHIAVPAAWTVLDAHHESAVDSRGRRLSDHDAYTFDAVQQ